MNRKLLTTKKCEEIYGISRIPLINYEKKIDNSCRKWKSKTATQKPVNQWKQQMRGLPTGRHKSWQVLSIALVFCCLEKSYKDLSSLKRVIISKDWIAVADRTLPKYRLLGSEVSEMAEYKYPNPNCASFIQFG
jgi:hypothetical protein